MDSAPDRLRVPSADLRRRTALDDLPFESTADVEPIAGVIGQEHAVDALRFGLATDAQGHNIFVRGLEGSGRMSLVRELLEDIQPWCPLTRDCCYVHDFVRPEQPMLIRLPRGQGRPFGQAIDELVRFIENDLGRVLDNESMRARRNALERKLRADGQALTQPFDAELRENQLAVAALNLGDSQQTTIVPLIDGEPVPPERYDQLVESGKVSKAEADAMRERMETFVERFGDLQRELFELQRTHGEALRDLHAAELRTTLLRHAARLHQRFPSDRVRAFLDALVEDLVQRFAQSRSDGETHVPTDLYRVNVLHSEPEARCPILIETRPTLTNLLGTIERDFPRQGGPATPDHLQIRAGALLRASGGFLILDARDLLAEPGAWQGLKRTLRSGRLQIAPAEAAIFGGHAGVKPDPIELDVKVILVGDAQLYYLLDGADSDFPHLFKVLADFASEIPRDATGHRQYAGVLARIARDRALPHFARDAVAELIDHGARIAGRADRLTARFGRLVDVAHEATFLARQAGHRVTDREAVRRAIQRGRDRADLPARRFRERITSGAVHVQTDGTAVGQVNGLAVISAGPLVFGFPQRITAAIGAGAEGAIDIEAMAQLSGSIHTKGFAILAGLLRTLLPVNHPLAFRVSLAFEQSYGGVDGDSASGAELCCLLSALTRLPIRQDLAMTGAIDQKGRIQPIGAVNEKIEGFYDVCEVVGLTGSQGVLIPRSNLGDLMLRQKVVEACEAGRFHVYAVERVHDAIELFFGRRAGELEDDRYPEDSVLHRAMQQAAAYWEMVSLGPRAAAAGGHGETGGESIALGREVEGDRRDI